MPFPKIPSSKFTFRRKKKWSELYWFDFGQPGSGQRTFAEPHPALIINNPEVTLFGTVLIFPVTGAERKRGGYEFHVPITKAECPDLDKDSVAKVDQIYCIENRFLPDQYFICVLDRRVMKKIYAKLLKVLNFSAVLG